MEVTYLLAILVQKDILSLDEAHKLRKSLRESVVNDNLTQMIEKVNKALETRESGIKVLDAKTVLS